MRKLGFPILTAALLVATTSKAQTLKDPTGLSDDSATWARRLGMDECTDPSRYPLSLLMAELRGVFDDSRLNAVCEIDGRGTARGRTLVHTALTSQSTGDYRVTDDALKNVYGGVSRDRFFGYELRLPDGTSNFIRDLHYDVGGGRAGYRPIPVADYGNVTAPDGSEVPGYQLLDDLLRREMDLGSDDPVFALLAFQHPEMYRGTLQQAGVEHLRTEMGQTHLGGYLGWGETRNAPENYHEMRFGVAGYPATVQVISMKGTDQATLNRNIHNTLTILNAGVKFPGDYKNDPYRTINLARTLKFYRDWILDESYLREEKDWFTYCAEHQTIALNIALNVPHNEKAFREIWGAEEGVLLWKKTRAKYRYITGSELPETHFEPLWKKEGLTDPTHVVQVGKSLAWAPQSTSDLMVNFLETYASPVDTGPEVTFAAMIGFKDIIKARTGITDMQYLRLAIPAMNKMLIADALMYPMHSRYDLERYISKKTQLLYTTFGGDARDLVTGQADANLLSMVDQVMEGVRLNEAEILRCAGVPKEVAWAWLRTALKGQLERQRRIPVQPGRVQWYSTPAITHRIALGMHPANEFVSIREVATIFDATELELKGR